MTSVDQYNIITGGPSAGKSSVLRELEVRGYRTLPEAAQLVTDRAISKDQDPDLLYGSEAFETRIESVDYKLAQIAREADGVVFFDRTYVDALAYREYFDLDTRDAEERVNDDLRDFTGNINVFILDLVGLTEDYHRQEEDEREAMNIHNQIVETYNDFGWAFNDIYHIEPSTVEQRADIVEGKIFNYIEQ